MKISKGHMLWLSHQPQKSLNWPIESRAPYQRSWDISINALIRPLCGAPWTLVFAIIMQACFRSQGNIFFLVMQKSAFQHVSHIADCADIDSALETIAEQK